MLIVWAPFILFDGIQVVFLYALRSVGDQFAAGINGIIGFFIVTGGLGWLLVRQLEIGPMALVYASAAGMVVAAVQSFGGFLSVSARRRSRSPAASEYGIAPCRAREFTYVWIQVGRVSYKK